MAAVEVKVPDIGDFDTVEVIEVLVKVGERIEPEQSLVTVERRQGIDGDSVVGGGCRRGAAGSRWATR